LLLSNSLYAETLNIAVHEFCPYLWEPAVKEKGKEGYVAEVLKAVYEPAGYKLKFHRVPYERGIRDTERGIFYMGNASIFSSYLTIIEVALKLEPFGPKLGFHGIRERSK
jgi:hypothetical protein